MSWLRIFEAYRNMEAEKVAADARAEFLQDQVTQLQARVETLDERSQQAQRLLLEDREKVADMFAVRVRRRLTTPNRISRGGTIRRGIPDPAGGAAGWKKGFMTKIANTLP